MSEGSRLPVVSVTPVEPPEEGAAMETPRARPGGGSEDRVKVTEVFFSVQGESSRAGLPCVLVRLTGCNLRCSWCDTAYSFSGGQWMTNDEVLAEVARHPTRRVELTGGEPLLQKGAPPLAARLLERGYEVLCETSGERDVSVLPAGVRRIMDLKPPGSGESHRNRLENLEHLGPNDEVKFVCTGRADFDWAVGLIRAHDLEGRVGLLLSPAYGQIEPRELAEWLLASGVDARLNLQLHKVLWGEVPGR